MSFQVQYHIINYNQSCSPLSISTCWNGRFSHAISLHATHYSILFTLILVQYSTAWCGLDHYIYICTRRLWIVIVILFHVMSNVCTIDSYCYCVSLLLYVQHDYGGTLLHLAVLVHIHHLSQWQQTEKVNVVERKCGRHLVTVMLRSLQLVTPVPVSKTPGGGGVSLSLYVSNR